MKIFISGETMRNASGEQEASKVKTSGSEKNRTGTQATKSLVRHFFSIKCVTRMFHVVVEY